MLNIKFKGILNKQLETKKLDTNWKKLIPRKKTFNGKSISFFTICIVLLLVFYRFRALPANNIDIRKLLLADLLALLFLIPVFIVHEILHALLYPKKSRKELWISKKGKFGFNFTLYCNEQVSRNRMLFIIILPNIILGVIPFLLWFTGIFDNYLIWTRVYGLLTGILLCGGYSDFAVFFDIILNVPKNSLVRFNGSYIFFKKSNPR